MIFKFNICDCEGCTNWYFDVDGNLTAREVIEKIYEAFINHIKNELDKGNKRPFGEKFCCAEREGIDFSDNLNKLNKEFEKVGLKKFKISNRSLWYPEGAYTLLEIDTECRGPENCQKILCDKIDWWQEEMKERKRRREKIKKILNEEILWRKWKYIKCTIYIGERSL